MTANTIWRTTGLAMVALLMVAFLGAWWLQFSGLLSLSPPPSDLVPAPDADVPADAALTLYQAAFTAWAALVLLIPTYTAFWFRNTAPQAWTVWLACWTTGAFAYLVHLGVSMFGFFDADFGWMMSSTRVSAFWPGMIIAVWWPLDIVLALRHGETSRAIKLQRILLHIIVLVLFVGGSAAKGELLTVRLIGAVLFIAAIASLFLWAIRQSKRHKRA